MLPPFLPIALLAIALLALLVWAWHALGRVTDAYLRMVDDDLGDETNGAGQGAPQRASPQSRSAMLLTPASMPAFGPRA